MMHEEQQEPADPGFLGRDHAETCEWARCDEPRATRSGAGGSVEQATQSHDQRIYVPGVDRTDGAVDLGRPMRSYLAVLLLAAPTLAAQTPKPRARDLGVPFDGTPGPLNAITDVAGVTVGQVTLIHGEGKLVRGEGPVRTGVTAIFPRGNHSPDPVFGGWFTLNGNGEMTGTTWSRRERGFLRGPVVISNTISVGTVHDAVIAWQIKNVPDADWALPFVAETWDGGLNDIFGFHVHQQDVFDAMDRATGGPVAEGVVGGGTGMVCHEFKGGIGTASRKLSVKDGGYTLGVLVQCNYGLRRRLTIARRSRSAKKSPSHSHVLRGTLGDAAEGGGIVRATSLAWLAMATKDPSLSSSPPTHRCFRIN